MRLEYVYDVRGRSMISDINIGEAGQGKPKPPGILEWIRKRF